MHTASVVDDHEMGIGDCILPDYPVRPITPEDERNAVSEVTRQRLIGRLQKDHGYSEAEAADVLSATIDFLKLIALNPGRCFAPSEKVDDGWHTFLLYTREYRAFCHTIAGRFIEHAPADNPEETRGMPNTVDTVEFMQEHGIEFNESLWFVDARGNCSNNGWCNGTPFCNGK